MVRFREDRSLCSREVALVAAVIIAVPSAGAQEPRTDVETARRAMFEAEGAMPLEACPDGDTRARVACLLELRFRKDSQAAATARSLYDKSGTVVGLLPAQSFDGEYRGKLRFVPHLPVGAERQHLEWLAQALLDLDAFYSDVGKDAPLRYRWDELLVLFFESVKRRTPSAIAQGWTVAYNVRGSLFKNPTRVRETLVHEIFHLNDQAHGDWSPKALSATYDAIVAKCGMKTACLEPYAPDEIKVIGGTYYAFMPDNGVREYAADLAKRWTIEHWALWKGQKPLRPFKCRTPENARAWKALADEFFGGVDRTAPCP